MTTASGVAERQMTPDENLQAHVLERLDLCRHVLDAEGTPTFMRRVIDELGALREQYGKDSFLEAVIPLARSHEVCEIIHEDPFTRHSFSQPRGYPGDADLLDLIYRHPSASHAYDAVTARGKSVAEFILGVAACEAVRERRTILANRIDEVATSRLKAEIMSLACGHLREAELSEAVKARQIARFVAGDQDERSLKVVAESAGRISAAVQPRRVRVRDVLTGASSELGQFDFIYAAGLYDYLDANLSAGLTARLFAHLKPGGALLIGNYLPGMWEVPYMETYMAWSLIYRTPAEIEAFASAIPAKAIASSRYFGDQSGCVGYLELQRA
jgi:SAM-dependent methyltransferase